MNVDLWDKASQLKVPSRPSPCPYRADTKPALLGCHLVQEVRLCAVLKDRVLPLQVFRIRTEPRV